MTDNETVMEAMYTVARVIQPWTVAIGNGECGDLAKGPHEKAFSENATGRLLLIDEAKESLPRLDILCVDVPRDDLGQLVYALKQNGYLWTKGRILDTPVLRKHSEYPGGFNLYVKTQFND